MFREQSQTVVLERWPSEATGDFMEFRLVYRGPLPPDKRGTVEIKQEIRRQFHPQMRSVWERHPSLSIRLKHPWKMRPSVEQIGQKFEGCGFNWVPLIREDNALACSLEFLILRRGDRFGSFDGSGDIHNRVKTLVDGLRMPKLQQNEKMKAFKPAEGERPFFVLLQDDDSIFDFTVTTDALLLPPQSHEPERDALVIVKVKTKSFSGSAISELDV